MNATQPPVVLIPLSNAMTTTHVPKTDAALSEDVSTNKLTAAILTLVQTTTVSPTLDVSTKTSNAMITMLVQTTTVTHMMDVSTQLLLAYAMTTMLVPLIAAILPMDVLISIM